MKRVVRVFVGALLLGLLALPFGPNAVEAAPPAVPTLLAPADGATGSTNPVLQWAAVPDAVRYRVQVSESPSFTSLVYSADTFNTYATPPSDLRQVAHYWRVASINAANEVSNFSSARSYTKTQPSGPVLVSPLDGANLNHPTDPLVFTWQPVPGARNYEIEIDDSPGFVSPVVKTTTDNTAFTLTDPVSIDVEFRWRVRASFPNGQNSQFSAERLFTLRWNQVPAPLSPPDTAFPPIDELNFSWTAVPGAVTYDLEVGTDQDFTQAPVLTANTRATRFSPAVNLNNGSYFWRVRARGLGAAIGPWSPARQFTKTFIGDPAAAGPGGSPDPLKTITPLTPADNSLVTTQLFSWTPMRHASSYQVQVARDVNFSSGQIEFTCTTNHTEWIPNDKCGLDQLDPGVQYWWRVRAVDAPGGWLSGWTTPLRFIYEPGTVNYLSPANGASVSVPILQWDPVTNIGRYRVVIRDGADNVVKSVDTYQRVYVPDQLPLEDDGSTLFKWAVMTLDLNNNVGVTPLGPWRTFTVLSPLLAQAAAPNPTTPNGTVGYMRVPLLQWQQAPLSEYEIWYGPRGSGIFSKLVGNLQFPAYAHPEVGISPGQYDWFVRAIPQPRTVPNASTTTGSTMVTAPSGSFNSFDVGATVSGGGIPNGTTIVSVTNSSTIVLSAAATETGTTTLTLSRSGAIDGATGWFEISTATPAVLTAPPHCPPSTACTALADTPMLQWQRDSYATGYRVTIAADALFTNVIYQISVREPRVVPPDSLRESQPGQAMYWYAQPCFNNGRSFCGADGASFAGNPSTPVRAFRKQSKAIELLQPVDGANDASVANDVRFDWRDFVETNLYTGAPVVTQEARQYRVQVSTAPDFATILDTIDTDATEFTSASKTYPDGPLYWRVAAIDGSTNALTFSSIRTLTKQSPKVNLTSPANGATVGSVPVLRWDPLVFSGAYEVEVYKNVGSPLSTANRVFQKVTRYTAAIPTAVLPPGTYGWRVRRLDADNRPGPWTADNNTQLRLFTLVPAAPNLVSPTNGQVLDTNTLLYDWDPSPGAVQYRIKVSTSPSFTSLLENQTTVMTEWAPIINYADGTYYWQVEALDTAGNLIATSAIRNFIKNANSNGDFYSIVPYRLLDTRQTNSPLVGGVRRDLVVTGGASTVPPSGVSAVVLNVTVTGPTMGSHLTVWPTGGSKPNVSNLNFVPGQTVPNLVVVKTGGPSSNTVSFENFQGSVHLIVDIVGYFSNGSLPIGSRFTPTSTPTRILDTRTTTPPSPWGPNQSRPVEVAGIGEVPADATAVVVNATVTGPTGAGYLTLYPDGGSAPTASNLNFVPGQTVPNLVMVKVGTNRSIRILNGGAQVGTTHVILDVVGYYRTGAPPPGSRYQPITPARILDTRSTTKLAANEVRQVPVAGQGGVPNMAANPAPVAVIMNVTVTGPVGPGHLTVFPSGVSAPNASNLNFAPGQTVPNLVVVKLGPDGKVQITSPTSVDVIFDVVGWFQAPT